jgi:hypothetical protein
LLKLKIINFALRTGEALLLVKIKVVREKARNASIIIPKEVVLALANVFIFVVNLT